MSLALGTAIYFILWWLVFIAVLPFGVRTIDETGESAPGHAPSAPSRPLLVRKVVVATVLAGVIWSGLYWLVIASGLSLSDLPFFRPPGEAG